MLKKGLLIFLSVILLVSLVGCGSSDSNNNSIKIGDVELLSLDNVPDDNSGNWRICNTTTTTPTIDYALDYYNTVFSSDDEIHTIINFSLNTTTRVSYSLGSLYVTTFEYVDKEEHSANTLYSGLKLKDYIVNVDTGKVEEI